MESSEQRDRDFIERTLLCLGYSEPTLGAMSDRARLQIIVNRQANVETEIDFSSYPPRVVCDPGE